jgi:hypothetical protein
LSAPPPAIAGDATMPNATMQQHNASARIPSSLKFGFRIRFEKSFG